MKPKVNPKKLRILLVFGALLLLLGLAALGIALAGSGGSGEIIYDCPGGCPSSISGPWGAWVVVKTFMDSSGCDPHLARCWTEWVTRNPHALMEMPNSPPGRIDRRSNVKDPDGWPPFGTVVDSRDWCFLASAGGRWGPAEGTWYLNAMARPSLVTKYNQLTGDWEVNCDWKLDTSQYYWSFGENDVCLYEDCSPNPTPAMTPTCEVQETPLIHTPEPAPSPTPIFDITPEDPSMKPLAYIRSTTMQPNPDIWYATNPNKGGFAWLWQLYLNARLTADPIPPSAPPGCSVDVDVQQYYFMGSNGVQVCPDPLSGDGFTPPETLVVLPPEGMSACTWRDPASEEIHILWTKEPVPPTQGASWNFYGVTPFQPNPFDPAIGHATIQYKLMATTTYTCNGFALSIPSFHNLTLMVSLVKPLRGH